MNERFQTLLKQTIYGFQIILIFETFSIFFFLAKFLSSFETVLLEALKTNGLSCNAVECIKIEL